MRKPRSTQTLVALLWALLLTTGTSRADDRPVITFTCSLSPDVPAAQKLKNYYTEAFDALGYRFEMLSRPTKRALVEAISGQSDGECARAQGSLSEDEREHLILLDVIVGASSINVWSRRDEAIQPAQLRHPELTVGYSQGARFTLTVLQKLTQSEPAHAPRLFEVNSDRTALRMLAFGRLDYIVGTQVLLEDAARVANIRGQLFNVGKLAELEAHPVLHRRHKDLATALNRELQAIVDRRGIIKPR